MNDHQLEWITVQKKVNDLLPLSINPRKQTAESKERLMNSLNKFNLADIPVINSDQTIISGHKRMEVLKQLGRGDEMIDVRMPNRLLTEKELKEYNLIANMHSGEWDFDLLQENYADIDLNAIGFDIDSVNTDEAILDEKEFTEEIPTENKCPKCGYEF